MMEHNLEHTISLLTRTPAALDALLRDLPETWTFRNESEESWSAFDVVGHLIHGERTDWMPRARMVLQFGETRAFESFDRWDTYERVKVRRWVSYWMNSLVCGQKTRANCVH